MLPLQSVDRANCRAVLKEGRRRPTRSDAMAMGAQLSGAGRLCLPRSQAGSGGLPAGGQAGCEPSGRVGATGEGRFGAWIARGMGGGAGGLLKSCRRASWGMGRISLRFWRGPQGGFRGGLARRRGGEDGRRQRLFGICDPGGERRHLFGVGEGPAEAAAGAKQERTCAQSSTAMGGQASGGLPLEGWEVGAVERSYQPRRSPGARQSARQTYTSGLRLIYA